MEGIESDALRAYSRIQSLLDLPDSYDDSNYLLETPHPEAKQQFSTPHSQVNTGRVAKAFETPATAPVFATEVALYNQDVRTTGLASLCINEESFERKLHPDEQVFHELLQQTMRQQQAGVVGTQAADNFAQAEIAGKYAFAAQERFVERAQEARRYGAGIDFGSAVKLGSDGPLGDRKTSMLQRGVQEQRAERDLWSLLEALTAANLMYDVDDAHCEEMSQKVLSALPITASIPDYLQASFAVDDRLRKGAILKEWIEKASLDLVTEAPAPRGEPWSETLTRVLKSRHAGSRSRAGTSTRAVQSLHPDGQLTEDGGMLALDGVDRLDQESLLKSIWQLLRCGQVGRAQELAAEHRLYWLSASLLGIASHAYKTVTLPTAGGLDGDQEMMSEGNEEVVGVARVGNLKQPMWLRTCWLYATKLSANPDNLTSQLQGGAPVAGRAFGGVGRGLAREDSLVGVLELSIYAALCNHTKVLLASPLVPSWQDKVWVMLKAAHERDVARIVHQYRCAKMSHSKYYAGCDGATISTERELFDLAKAEIGHISTANCVQVFHKIPPPAGGKIAEFFLLNLQAAVMEGRSGILNYIENTMSEFFHSTDKFPGRDQVVRVFCHFCIWLKYAHADSALLSELLSLDTLYTAVEAHIDVLIENKQRSLVAAYAAFLNRPRRIGKYAQLLQSMQTSTTVGGALGQSADATEVLQLANIFFPADVMEITRTVVEGAHSLPSPVPTQASAHKRTPGKTLRAPPLLSITSPLGKDQQGFPKHSAAKGIVRFAVAEDESADDFAVTPSKFSVRNRTATPRPLRNLGDTSTPQSKRGASTPGSTGRPSMGGLPGTPQVGSELLMLSAGAAATSAEDGGDVPVHTRLRAADVTQAVSAEDTQQLESLRWLFFENSHRIEAVKQANRFASSFLLHRDGMKVAQVRLLLADYVPLDSVAVGNALVAQRQHDVTDVEQQYLHEQEVSNVQLLPAEQRALVAHLREELEVDEKVWDAQVCKLRLWQDFTSATQDVDMFYRAVAEFQAESSRLLTVPHSVSAGMSTVPSALGRHRSKIVRTASTAADAVLRALTCTSPPGGDADGSRNPADGFKDIWAQNESACSAYIVNTVRMLVENISALLDGGEGASGEEINTAGWVKIDSAIAALWEMVNEVYPLGRPEEGEAVREHPVRNAVGQLAALDLPGQSLGDGEDSGAMLGDSVGPSALSDAALSVLTALSQCRLHLCDIRDGKLLAGGLLFQLLSTYIQVCMSAGSVLQSLAHSRDAAAWFGRAMQLADLIAAEDHALQLYTLLHREDLEALLLGINTAALALLAVDPDMSIQSQQA